MLQEITRISPRRFFWFLPLFLTVSLSTACQNTSEVIEIEWKTRDCRVPMHYRAPGQMDHVAVVGDFNNWDPGAHPLHDPEGDQDYFGHLELPPGAYHYAIWVDGYVFPDTTNPLSHFDAESTEYSYVVVEDCSQPAWEALSLVSNADGRVEASFDFLTSRSGAGLDLNSLVLQINGESFPGSNFEVNQDALLLKASGLEQGRYVFELHGEDLEGMPIEPWRSVVWIESKPFEWEDALIYQIVVDRFYNPQAALETDVPISYYHGGTLDGISDKIEAGYFERLGVNALWLSPLNENADEIYVGRDQYTAQAYHGYWARSAREVEERFGAEAALKRLVKTAHENGIRVVMDYVLNHVHVDHPYFENPDWINGVDEDCICGITCPWGENMLTCWFDPFLADLNWKNPEVVEQLTDDALFWLEQFDLDGLRLDAIPMMPRLSTRQLRKKINDKWDQKFNHTYLLGETYTGSAGHGQIRHYLGEYGLSGQFEFPTMWTLRSALRGHESMQALHAQVLRSARAWDGAGAVMAPILGNHDVPRMISDLAGDALWSPRTQPAPAIENGVPYELLKTGWTFIMTQPGAPVIYYGDEFGMVGANDPDNRRNMRFGSQLDLFESATLDHVSKLGRLRQCSDVIRRGKTSLVYVDDELYVYKKVLQKDEAWIYLNRSSQPRLTRMHPEQDETWYAPLGSSLEKTDGRIQIDPYASLILTNHPTCLEEQL